MWVNMTSSSQSSVKQNELGWQLQNSLLKDILSRHNHENRHMGKWSREIPWSKFMLYSQLIFCQGATIAEQSLRWLVLGQGNIKIWPPFFHTWISQWIKDLKIWFKILGGQSWYTYNISTQKTRTGLSRV